MKFSRRNFIRMAAMAAVGVLFPKARAPEQEWEKATVNGVNGFWKKASVDELEQGRVDPGEIVQPGSDCDECEKADLEKLGCCGMKNYAAGFDVPDEWYAAAQHGAINDDGTIGPECTTFEDVQADLDKHLGAAFRQTLDVEPEPVVFDFTAEGWPASDSHVFVVQPGNKWVPFDSIADAVDFVGEHGTPSQPKDPIYVMGENDQEVTFGYGVHDYET